MCPGGQVGSDDHQDLSAALTLLLNQVCGLTNFTTHFETAAKQAFKKNKQNLQHSS